MIPDSEYDKVLQQFTWTLLVLLYFAACDGAIKPNERMLIAEFFKRRNPNAELDTSKVEDALKLLGRPDKSSFHKLVRERSAEPGILQDVFNTAQAIMRSNPKPHTEQERAIEYLRKRWKDRIVA